jgi:esterase/lipase
MRFLLSPSSLKLSVLIALSIFGFGCGSSPSNDSACLDQMQSSLTAIDQAEDAHAAEIDPGESAVRPGNQTVLLRGDPNRVVFLLHGFISSPYEVASLGKSLNAQGYTVVMPLLAGYGRSTYMAENTSSQEWLDQTQKQLTAAQGCGKKIQVVGFSLGALVETKLILEHPEIQSQVASLTLLSPALVVRHDSMMDAASVLFKFLNSTPSLHFLAKLARKLGNFDLDIPESHPDYYNSSLPLKTVTQLSNLAKSVDFSLFANVKMPIKVIYSESDHTINGASGLAAILAYQPNTTSFVIPYAEEVPHQLLLANTPGICDEITEQVTQNFAGANP